MKKSLVCLGLSVLCLSSFVACGKTNANSTETETATDMSAEYQFTATPENTPSKLGDIYIATDCKRELDHVELVEANTFDEDGKEKDEKITVQSPVFSDKAHDDTVYFLVVSDENSTVKAENTKNLTVEDMNVIPTDMSSDEVHDKFNGVILSELSNLRAVGVKSVRVIKVTMAENDGAGKLTLPSEEGDKTYDFELLHDEEYVVCRFPDGANRPNTFYSIW